MLKKLDPEFRKRLLREPDGSVRLMVGVEGDLGARAEELRQRGLAVHRRLGIIGALAASGTGRQALALGEVPWVSWIEEDREVRALGRHPEA
jgi:hypothetical protein